MTNKKIYWTDENLSQAIVASTSIREVMQRLGLPVGQGCYYRRFHTDIKRLSLDISHFDPWKNNRKCASKNKQLPYSLILTEDSPYPWTASLRKRLIKDNLLTNECAICAQLPVWFGKPLSLQLDHINGVNTDNRIENLRILCPHCHSQTSTFGGRNIKNNYAFKFKEAVTCLDCSISISPKSTRCVRCTNLLKNTPKIDWPETDVLLAQLQTSNYSALGRELGVSDNAIRKHLRMKIGRCP